MKRFLSFACTLSMAAALSGCQTPRHKEFEKIQVGMDKTDVLEAAGGPNYSRRSQSKDRWVYDLQSEPGNRQVKEVHFENGKAVYVGAKVQPKISAEEQDRLNEESNLQEEARLREIEVKRLKALGAVTLDQIEKGEASDEEDPLLKDKNYDRKLRFQFYGVTEKDSTNSESRKSAPVWEPVR